MSNLTVAGPKRDASACRMLPRRPSPLPIRRQRGDRAQVVGYGWDMRGQWQCFRRVSWRERRRCGWCGHKVWEFERRRQGRSCWESSAGGDGVSRHRWRGCQRRRRGKDKGGQHSSGSANDMNEPAIAARTVPSTI